MSVLNAVGFNGTLDRKEMASNLVSGLIVFLVALPLCLGVALASGTPLFAGIVSGVIGGLVVGLISGSQTSVSGPSPGQVAVVIAQMSILGRFDAFLAALVISGLVQIVFGVIRVGTISAFVPNNVIKGLLAAIGVILILKQIPHILGHDTDPEGEMAFIQPDQETTFTELLGIYGDFHQGAALIGILSLAMLYAWDRYRLGSRLGMPAALAVVLVGVVGKLLFNLVGGAWAIEATHLVQVPIASSFNDFIGSFQWPDFSAFLSPTVYLSGLTIAIVSSIETLLNLEAIDKIDPQRRKSPQNLELLAQGVGNVLAGLMGGLPIASVIVRSKLNIESGATNKLSAIFHGIFLLLCVLLVPQYLNLIPLSCLAAILFFTGVKLARPQLFVEMWKSGLSQFMPFFATMVAIVLTDLLTGIVIGVAVSLAFILYRNLKRPMQIVIENHLGGEVIRFDLANQVSFLNRASMQEEFDKLPRGAHLMIDASDSYFIDTDILDLIRDFSVNVAPLRGIKVSLNGFQDHYDLKNQIQYIDYSSRELQEKITPEQALRVLLDGNERFREGRQLSRDFTRIVSATSAGQHPMAVVLSCIDSRSPAELIFDLGIGDIFSIRIAGNISGPKVLGSMEYGTAVAGAKLLVVLGHTRCGAVTAAVNFAGSVESIEKQTGCQHLHAVIDRIQQSFDTIPAMTQTDAGSKTLEFVDEVAANNVVYTARQIMQRSETIRQLVDDHRIAVVAGIYDVGSGRVRIIPEGTFGLDLSTLPADNFKELTLYKA